MYEYLNFKCCHTIPGLWGLQWIFIYGMLGVWMLVKSPALSNVLTCPEQHWHPLPSLRLEHSQCQETKSLWLYHKPPLALSHVSTWKTLALSLHLDSSWQKTKIITCTAVSQMPLCIVTVSYMLEHLLDQEEPFWQNCWAGYFGPTLSNPVLLQHPWKSAGCDILTPASYRDNVNSEL